MSEITLEDVQSQVPTLHGLALARGRHERREGHPDPGERRASSSTRRGSTASSISGPQQKGAHMSRFEEVVNDAIGEVVLGESALRAETLAQHIAEKVRDRQGARRAEVHIEARYPEHKPAPESGILTQEIYSLLGVAVASEAGTRRLVGVRAQGMTACPCAQTLVEGALARAAARRTASREAEIERIFEAVPVATHNQRGLGTLHIGCPENCDTDINAAGAARDRRELDVVGDLRADEALRRGRGGREGPPAAAVRRGLRARDGARRGRALPDPHRPPLRLGAPGEPGDDPPAQRDRRALRAASTRSGASSRRASTRRTRSRGDVLSDDALHAPRSAARTVSRIAVAQVVGELGGDAPGSTSETRRWRSANSWRSDSLNAPTPNLLRL